GGEHHPLRRALAESLGRHPDELETWPESVEPAMLAAALGRQGMARLDSFLVGVDAYHRSAHSRSISAPPAAWTRGAARLLDYGGDGAPAVFVPSLVNRAYILDLYEDRSLARSSAASGLRTYVLDWGHPGREELGFSIEDYVCRVLIPALEEIRR